MDEELARTLCIGDLVLYRDAVHKVVGVALWPSKVFKLQGPYAADTYVSYTLLDFPVLQPPPAQEA